MLLVFACALVLGLYWRTVLVKAMGHGFIVCLLVAVLLDFLAPFVLLAPPSNAVCVGMRFVTGLAYTLSASTMLVKSRLLHR